MHFEYIRFNEPVQSPGKGGNNSTSFRVGDVQQGTVQTHMHAIYEKGDWIVLEDKRGEKRMSPRTNVVDACEEGEQTKAYRAKEVETLKARAAAAAKEARS